MLTPSQTKSVPCIRRLVLLVISELLAPSVLRLTVWILLLVSKVSSLELLVQRMWRQVLSLQWTA
jgi:hypothetical protein